MTIEEPYCNIAHIRKEDRIAQPLLEHLRNVSELTSTFAKKVGLEKTGKTIGYMHDLGKASQIFQKYILSGEGILNPDADGYIDPISMRGKIDHSTAGAQLINEYYNNSGVEGRITAQALALCVASHHSGLIDCLTPTGENNFIKRMTKQDKDTHKMETVSNILNIDPDLYKYLSTEVIDEFCSRIKSLHAKGMDSSVSLEFKRGLLVRFLMSCLIDADRLDTADFCAPDNKENRKYGQYPSWKALIQRLNERLRRFDEKENKNDVDRLRAQVSQACLEFSTKPKGIFHLSVPTGGGKTLASLRFALNHAAHHKLDRIFYIIPYTSIIDQNADEVRKILEERDSKGFLMDHVVLEHHSNLTPEEETPLHNLLAQNWDAPIVFITQVQFLETLFGFGTRSARRMHQLANSVLIFDEVQTLPVRCVHMFNLTLRFLVETCGSSLVLCTATQPLLDKVKPVQFSLPTNKDSRIIVNEEELYEKLRRVEVHDCRKAGGWEDEEIANLASEQLKELGNVLVIVNTRASARTLTRILLSRNIAPVFHLSTNMCPAHRLEVLKSVRGKLERNEPVICVSTQLIEAGVDIDFNAVIRYLAGLDSIIQAAGRCNRNGRFNLGKVWIVNPFNEKTGKLTEIRVGTEISERVLDDFNANPANYQNDRLGLIALKTYFQYYFFARSNMMGYPVESDSPIGRADNLVNLLSTNTISLAEHQRVFQSAPSISYLQSFLTAAKAFRVIDQSTSGVVVPFGTEGNKLVNELRETGSPEYQRVLVKKAQRFSVNLFSDEFERLKASQIIKETQPDSGIFILDQQYYSQYFGWSEEKSEESDQG